MIKVTAQSCLDSPARTRRRISPFKVMPGRRLAVHAGKLAPASKADAAATHMLCATYQAGDCRDTNVVRAQKRESV